MNAIRTINTRSFLSIVLAATCAIGASAAHTLADVVIYEPFAAQSLGDLNSQTTGDGLTGNWTAGTGLDVVSGGLSYGDLAVSGNRVALTGTTGWNNAVASIGTSLSGAGLLADNADLWFSVLARTTTGGTNDRITFALGTNSMGASGGMNGSGDGIGFSIERSSRLTANTWASGARDDITAFQSITADTLFLVVGHIKWGVDGAAADTIDIYLPGTDLVLPAIKDTATAVLNQALFTSISFGGKQTAPVIDEIRFGDSYAAVTPTVPAPAALPAGLAMIGLVAARRRRRHG